MVKVSYSQYGMYSSCQKKFKYNYIDKLGISGANIHTIFGSSVHETIQHFLEVMYNESKKKALEIDIEKLLYTRLVENFKIENEKLPDGQYPCTKEELDDAFSDGRLSLRYFKSKLSKLYTKTGFELIAIEMKLDTEIKPGVSFIGFIDVLLKDVASDQVIVIDLKTSTRGWSSYQKNDKVKTSQMLLYKKFYSDLYNIPLDKIRVEYQIIKRKLPDNTPYAVPRISKFIPPHGKPSVTKAYNSFKQFVDEVYDDNGDVIQREYPATKGRHCDWCEFKERGICSEWIS